MGTTALPDLSGGAGGGTRLTINQPGHGFVAGNAIRFDETTAKYVKAIANSSENAEVVGVVESATASSFTIVINGKIESGSFTVENSGVDGQPESGNVYFLSSTIEGKLTDSPPSTTGTIRKAVLLQTNVGGIGFIQNYIGLVNGLDANNIVDISEVQPVGTISPYAGSINNIPNGWLLCDGSYISSAEYTELTQILGSAYGPIQGTQYRLPDLRGRFALGSNPEGDLGTGTFTRRAIGANGGSETHALTIEQLPSHNHTAFYNAYRDDLVDTFPEQEIYGGPFGFFTGTAPTVDFPNPTPGGSPIPVPVTLVGNDFPVVSNDWQGHFGTGLSDDTDYGIDNISVNVSNIGSNQPHNNMPPFTAVNYIIKASSSANAAILSVTVTGLNDVNSTRGFSNLSNQQKNGDVLSWNTNQQKFVVRPDITTENFCRNGSIRIWQRGNTFVDSSSAFYTADNWYYRRSGSASFTIQKGTVSGVAFSETNSQHDFVPGRSRASDINPNRFADTIQLLKSANITVSDNDYHQLTFAVEGYDFARLWQSDYITLSFWAYTSNTAFNNSNNRLSVVFKNKTLSRYYIDTFSPTVNTWTKHRIIVPISELDASQWEFGADIGIQVSFVLNAGTNRRVSTVADTRAWKNGNFFAAPSQYNLTTNTTELPVGGTALEIAQVQLEAGAFTTNFTCPSFQEEIEIAQRYYEKSYDLFETPGSLNSPGIHAEDYFLNQVAHVGTQFSTRKRTRPIVRIYNPETGTADEVYLRHGESGFQDQSYSVLGASASQKTLSEITLSNDTTGIPGSGKNKIYYHYVADAELFTTNASNTD